MNKRALLISLIIGIIGVMIMLLYVRRFEQQASGGERVTLLVAVKPIERGSVINNESVTAREVPRAYVESRAVRFADKSKVLGLRAGTTLRPQQTLMWTDLAIAADERRDLSALIEQGSRAISIPAQGRDKSFSMIRPGDYVDLIATMSDPSSPGKQKSVVLLQKVLVLAVGLETTVDALQADRGPRMREMVLTLSVQLPQAQLISLAMDQGDITVALRNPDDQRVADRIPDISSSALVETKEREAIQTGRSRPIKLEAGGTQ